MKRVKLQHTMLILAFGLCGFLYAENMAEIEKNISTNQAKLQAKTKEQQQLSNRLITLGNTINERKKQIEKLQSQIAFIQQNISQSQSQSQSQAKKLDDLQQSLKTLESKKTQLQTNIANLLAQDLAFVLILDKQSLISPDDIILEDVFNLLTKQSQKQILALSQQQTQINARISSITNNIDEISTLINLQQNKKDELQRMINEQKSLSEQLQAEINDYNKRFAQIGEEREGLDKILQNLNIIKINKKKELEALALKKAKEEEEARKKQEQEKAAAAAAAQKLAQSQPKSTPSPKPQAPQQSPQTKPTQQIAQNPPPKMVINQVATSYQHISVAKYNGEKTISPLESYSIEQKFGPYYDPVYNLKVFNVSVTLLSKTPDATVRSIMAGKVVYAKEAPVLKKVVIIEHNNEMYSIYSQLDKISPTVKPGFIVKKNYVIGRVSQRLGLEITQKDKHIDPLEVIGKSQ